jgi:hypothetical protein
MLIYYNLEHDNMEAIRDMFESLRHYAIGNGSYSLLIFNSSLSNRTKDTDNKPHTYNKDDGNLYTKDGRICTFIDTSIKDGNTVLLAEDYIEALDEEISRRTYQIQLT